MQCGREDGWEVPTSEDDDGARREGAPNEASTRTEVLCWDVSEALTLATCMRSSDPNRRHKLASLSLLYKQGLEPKRDYL